MVTSISVALSKVGVSGVSLGRKLFRNAVRKASLRASCRSTPRLWLGTYQKVRSNQS